jgi:hypothetical protein
MRKREESGCIGDASTEFSGDIAMDGPPAAMYQHGQWDSWEHGAVWCCLTPFSSILHESVDLDMNGLDPFHRAAADPRIRNLIPRDAQHDPKEKD